MPILGKLRFLRTKRGALIAMGTSAGLAGGAFALAYFVLFPTSAPKPFSLTATASPSTNPAAGTAASGGTLAGTWKIGSGSQVGYRVREKLVFLPAQSDAVGRTSEVTGSLTVATSGRTTKVASASFSAAVNTLKSDRSMRDDRIHTIGLESDKYPTATFKLVKPFTFPQNA
ncbi:MAG TPA: YceI family protein, partial [Gaiellaceae bacterium]|nr:YceI family protein [Gaiellaceae bacterium]